MRAGDDPPPPENVTLHASSSSSFPLEPAEQLMPIVVVKLERLVDPSFCKTVRVD